ncbi:hypothetical protein SNE40_008196 [Patella caerulea]|uniref:Peptidase S1 domain-containing protein n=1 Tax=Patella caerulea TaxID=87958 RepID=A0AAN8JYD3_PATCE
MMLFVAVIIGLSSSASAQNLCESYLVGQQGKCLKSCSGYGEPNNDLGPYGCLFNFGNTCCVKKRETTTTTTTTTTKRPITTTLSTTALPVEIPCGVRSNPNAELGRILGGFQTSPCDWPWQVSIRGKTSPTSTETVPYCSGILIDNLWVVTTAYCALVSSFQAPTGGTSTDSLSVVVGEYNTDVPDIVSNNPIETTLKVSNIIIHENYYKTDPALFTINDVFNNTLDKESYNIALLKLQRPATFGKCVRKVCLPSVQTTCSLTKTCMIAGWGVNKKTEFLPLDEDVPRTLQEAEVELIKSEVMQLFNTFVDTTTTVKPLTNYARFTKSAGNTCTNDNGGMVVCRNSEGRWALDGIINVPYVRGCDVSNGFLVTDVSAAYNWIQDTINSP